MTDIAEPHIARGSTFGAPGALYTGAPMAQQSMTVVQPPQASMRAGGETKRRTGLLPAVAGARFPVVVRDNPGKRVDPRKLAELRGAVRRCEAAEKAARGPWVESTHGGANPGGDPALREAYTKAVDLLAATRRELADAESMARGRPTQVKLVEAREPSAAAHAFDPDYEPPHYVCLHDGCAGDEWTSEADMRRAHPSANEMAQRQQAHVFALYSTAPVDPADPDGEPIGLIAPVGTDGSTVAAVSAQAAGDTASAADVEALKAQIEELKALVAGKAGDGKKGGPKT